MLKGLKTFSKSVPRRGLWIAAWVGALLGSLWLAGVGREAIFNWGGLPLLGQFLRASLTPALDAAFLGVIGQATLTTLAYAVCGTFLSVLIGLVGGILTSQVWWQSDSSLWGRGIWLGLRGGLAVPRAIHELIWGLFLINILGLDPLVAVLAIAIPFGAITAKVFSEILDETPQEPLQALRHSGVPPLTAFLYAHLPQALPNLLSYMFYRFECALRASAVLGVIGAGGLGYEISLSLQSLRYEQLWTGFYALILLNGAVDTWSATLRRQMGFTSRLDLNYGTPNPSGQTIQSPSPRGEGFRQRASRAATKRRIRPLVWASWLGIAVAVPLCFSYLQLDWSRLWAERTRSLLAEILTQVSPSQVLPEFSGALPSLALQTLAMSILAMTLASIGGVLFSFPAAQNVWLPGGLLRPMGETSRGLELSQLWLVASRLLLLVARAIPAPIWALVILYGVFPSLLPGALALALHNFGILGRLMAEVNENLPDPPIRALRSLGAGSGGLIFYGILPQNLPRFLAYSLYRWEVCMRETVIVGLVGAGGLGRLMAEQISSFDYGGLAATLTVFVGLTFAVDLISAAMRRDFR